jgi:hypothetical protein
LESTIQSTKWIVVTTIQGPTDSVRLLTRLQPDWRLVIVGDKKSPPTYEFVFYILFAEIVIVGLTHVIFITARCTIYDLTKLNCYTLILQLTCCSLAGAIFLDVHKQQALGYATAKYMPFNSYARKMIGYLYAIEVTLVINCGFQQLPV